MTTDSTPLQSRVLCIGRGVAAAFATRLLADLGASCSWWQWSKGRPGDWPEDGVFRSYFEHEVEVVDTPANLAAVLDRLPSLAPSFDLIVTDFSANEVPQAAILNLVRDTNPALVVANADHFGRTGPYANWVGDELTDYAMGGYWAIAGDPAREPLRVPGYQAQFHAGTQLAFAALVALRHARLTGEGQEVESNGFEAMLGAHWSTTIAWTHEGRVFKRTGSDIFRTADGWVFFYQMAFYPNICILIDQIELMEDPRWTTPTAWMANAPEFWEIVAEWCKDKTVEEIVLAAQGLRVPVTPVEDAQRLLNDGVLRERKFFREVNGKDLPGQSTRWDDEVWPLKAPSRLAPLLAAPPVPAPRLAAVTTTTTSTVPVPGGALRGLRVLELTNNWAGPIAGRHLADLGAEVIKIELATKPATRASHWPNKLPGKAYWNRSGYFNEMNRNKRGLCLNLATDRGRELFLKLVEQSDVVVENNSSRVMPNLGVGYKTLKEVNPRIVMASICGFGATGDRRDWVAFGSNVEATTGLAVVTGYPGDETPYRTGTFVADPVGGVQAAIAIMAALERRDRTGRGAHIDISLVEATLPYMLYTFSHLHNTGSMLKPVGNGDLADAPTGAYPAIETDEWLAIAVRTDEQYAALAKVAGLQPATADRATRIKLREDLDRQIGAWTRTQAQMHAVRALQAAGVAAAPILHNWQMHSDPHIYRRNTFINIEHPDMGVFPYPGYMWEFSHTPPVLRYASPAFGEGNRYVFSELLKLSEPEIAALYEGNVTSDDPINIPSYG